MMLGDRVYEYALTPYRREASSLPYTVKHRYEGLPLTAYFAERMSSLLYIENPDFQHLLIFHRIHHTLLLFMATERFFRLIHD